MGKINSRQKGAAGEREWARFLTKYGYKAFRGRQFSGADDSPDVRCDDIPFIHHEVKRVQQLNISTALSQSERDARDKIPIVAHRRNGERWKVTLYADDFLRYFVASFIKVLNGGQKEIFPEAKGECEKE